LCAGVTIVRAFSCSGGDFGLKTGVFGAGIPGFEAACLCARGVSTICGAAEPFFFERAEFVDQLLALGAQHFGLLAVARQRTQPADNTSRG